MTVNCKLPIKLDLFNEIDCLKGKVGVQFALLAVFVDTVKVIDAVCYVARLLYLNDKVARADTVHAAGRLLDDVAVTGSEAV